MAKSNSGNTQFRDSDYSFDTDAISDPLSLLLTSTNIDFLQLINVLNGGQSGAGSSAASGADDASASHASGGAQDLGGGSFALGAEAQAAAITVITKAAVIGGTAPQTALKQLWTNSDLPIDNLFAQQWHLNNTGQYGGVRGVDIDVLPVWAQGITGKGVSIGVFDTACDVRHTDLDGNVDLSKIITGAMVADGAFVDPTKITSVDQHSTSVSGIISGERDGSGVVGVAYNSKFTPVDILGQTSGNYTWEAVRQEYRFDVANNSWGFTNAFGLNALDAGVQYWVTGGFKIAADSGRNGLGTIVTLAAGNYRQSGQTTETNGATVDRHAIEVGACDNTGMVSYYSNPGASLLLVAPSSGSAVGITTDDVTGALGYSATNYTSGFGGTSAATPEISGVAALMLQTNAMLGWRDVQDILALTARHVGTAINNGKSGYEADTWSFNHATNVNGGGLHFSNDYGFGLVDAAAAVRLAQSWGLVHNGAQTSANEVAASVSYSSATALDVGHGRTTTLSFNFTTHESVESMVLDLTNLKFDRSADLSVTLTSATGTVSQLLSNNGGAQSLTITSGWELMSREFLGEDAYGTWKVTISSSNGADIGTLSQAKLTAYGSNLANNNIEYYTDEFVTYANADISRATLGGNITAIDAAAITGACNVNLATKVASIDGKAISLGSANVSIVVGGAGDDSLVAGSLGAKLYSGQGNDVLVGGNGADLLDGGVGTNTITTGGGADNILMHLRGTDNITDFTKVSDHLLLSRSEFAAFANDQMVSAIDFLSVTSGNVSASHVAGGGLVYDTMHNDLYYDADGRSALSLIAHLNNTTKLAASDITLVA